MTRKAFPTITRGEVVNAVRRLADEYGERLTRDTFCRESGYHRRLVFRLFGSWNGLRRRAGLRDSRPGPPPTRTAEDIQQALREAVARHGENVTFYQFNQATGISHTSVARHFRNWRELRTSIGLSPRARQAKYYSEFDLMADLWRAAQKARKYDGLRPRRCPTVAQQHRFGTITPVTLRNRYGSWRNVRLVFEIFRRAGLMPPPEDDAATGPGGG